MLARIREKLIAFRQKTALSNKRIAALFIVLLTVIALPLMVIVSQQEQDIRQRASELVSPPLPPVNAINWTTDYASLQADNFFIKIDDRIFRPNASLQLHSNPGSGTDPTLEAIWFEEKTEMRLFIYFSLDTIKNQWKTTEMRTYNGNVQGDWLYYSGSESGELGNPFISNNYSKQSNNNKGSINFGQIKLQPFFVTATPTPTPTSSTSITIISPNGGEVWEVGKSYNIVWKSSDDIKKVYIALSYTRPGESGTWTIANDTPNTGQYTYTPPSYVLSSKYPNNYKIYMSKYLGDLKSQDYSDNYFSIVPPAPTPTLTPTPTPWPTKKAFITDTNYNGDLKTAGSSVGLGSASDGLDGADKICQSKAIAAGLSGTYRAWLSNGTVSAENRLTHGLSAYIKTGAAAITIADNWSDLTDGALASSISNTASGAFQTGSLPTWTNTKTNGALFSANSCNNWTNDSPRYSAAYGFGASKSRFWTYAFSVTCDSLRRLYCLEQ